MPLGPREQAAPCSDAVSDTTEEEEEEEGASDLTGQLEQEQERFRSLFGVFDSNQDGFLDR